MSDYREASTPDLDDVQQLEESERFINVPVRVTEIGPVRTQSLPARDASMRMVTITDSSTVQQIVGGNLRRQSISLWATCSGTDNKVLYVGTDKNQVESGNAAQLPAMNNVYTNGIPMVLTMHHTLPVWVKAPVGSPDIQLSIVTEDWAD